MKLKFTRLAIAFSLAGISTAAMSQDMKTDTSNLFNKKSFRTFSIGINGGMLTHYTPFNGPNNGDFHTPEEKFGYGGYIKEQILPGFGIQADFLTGKVNGYKANSLPTNSAAQTNSSFETNIQWSAALSGNFTVANLSFNQRHNVLSPYLTAGVGYMSYSANVRNTPDGVSTPYQEKWFVPVGAGVKFGLSNVLNLDFGYTVDFMKTSDFDGVRSNAFDKFSYAHAGLEFVLGKKKAPQLSNFSPIAELRVESAALRAKIAADQAAAEQARLAALQQYNADRAQYAQDMGDEDGDGVANKFDKCPGTPANTQVDGSGCPLKIPAKVTEKVIITEEDRRVVGEAIKNLEFDLGKATIKEKSYPTLDRVADLLMQKHFSLKLAGHTDNTGKPDLNLRLSKDRAESVKAYLVSKGANASIIEATGYGQTQPIASNKTAAGRQKNRRVEFSLL